MGEVLKVRDQTIDIAKGIAIFAIVLGHVLRGLSASGIVDSTSTLFIEVDRLLYTGHLVVFAFLSGLFVRSGLAKRGTAAYLRPRLAVFLYLYILWQVLQLTVKLATGTLVNSPVELSEMLKFWKPEGQLWFLPFLMVATLLTVLAKPWTRPWVLFPFAVAALTAWGFDGGVAGTQGLALLLPFAVGTTIGASTILRLTREVKSLVAVLVLVGGVTTLVIILRTTGAIPPTVINTGRTVTDIGWGVIAATCFLIALMALSLLLARLRVFGWLAFLGERSLEIFLAHIIAASGVRILLGLTDVIHIPTHITAGLLAGLLIPLVLWAILERTNFPWLFRAPPALTGNQKFNMRSGSEK